MRRRFGFARLALSTMLLLAFYTPSWGSHISRTAASSCSGTSQAAGGATAGFGSGISQPLVGSGPFSAASIDIPAWEASFSLWDPVNLRPDPATVALRRTTLGSSFGGATGAAFAPNPVVVTSPVAGVADYVSTNVVFEGFGGGGGYTRSSGPVASAFAAYSFATQNGPRSLLASDGPPSTHSATTLSCEDTILARLAQAVMSTSALPAPAQRNYLQVFRVARPIYVDWVELAFHDIVASDQAVAKVINPNGASVPPVTLPIAGFTGTANFNVIYPTPAWAPLTSFLPQGMLLLPGRDYWLYVSSGWSLYEHEITGGESSDFVDHIGPLYSSTSDGGTLVPRPSRALCFRIIGHLSGTLAAPRSAQVDAPKLAAVPNPSRHAFRLNLPSGETFASIEVLDAQGRRVARPPVTEARDNATWSGCDDRGALMPNGTYLVVVRTKSGLRRSTRVVLER